ncbi:hypothetical protein [Sorangium sp. So ce513]|uniref:hypothetical protein n=1 Tax=Sorangium sp. So ce513 TaxID=3133315 RepID=UPI003F62F25C
MRPAAQISYSSIVCVQRVPAQRVLFLRRAFLRRAFVPAPRAARRRPAQRVLFVRRAPSALTLRRAPRVVVPRSSPASRVRPARGDGIGAGDAPSAGVSGGRARRGNTGVAVGAASPVDAGR